jgi:hypothetical protein
MTTTAFAAAVIAGIATPRTWYQSRCSAALRRLQLRLVHRSLRGRTAFVIVAFVMGALSLASAVSMVVDRGPGSDGRDRS